MKNYSYWEFEGSKMSTEKNQHILLDDPNKMMDQQLNSSFEAHSAHSDEELKPKINKQDESIIVIFIFYPLHHI